jgi:hypothetical protein
MSKPSSSLEQPCEGLRARIEEKLNLMFAPQEKAEVFVAFVKFTDNSHKLLKQTSYYPGYEGLFYVFRFRGIAGIEQMRFLMPAFADKWFHSNWKELFRITGNPGPNLKAVEPAKVDSVSSPQGSESLWQIKVNGSMEFGVNPPSSGTGGANVSLAPHRR